MKRKAVAATLPLLPVVFLACLVHEQPLPGCLSDRDCKLDRVCDGGRCVWPGGSSPGALPPAGEASRAPAQNPKAKLAPPPPLSRPPESAGVPLATMFRMGPQHRGQSPFTLPARRPEIAWAYETRGAITGAAAITEDGLIAIGSHDGKLHALDEKGTTLWLQATGDLIFSSPAIGRNDVLYVGSDDDHLYAFGLKDGKIKWKFQIGSCPLSIGPTPGASRCDADAGPTIGPDGTIYTGGDGIYAINPDGTLHWRFATQGHVSSAPALMPDGTVVAGCQDNSIYAINPDGTKKWDFRAGDDVEASPAIAADGTIYVGSDDQKLYALAQDGSLRWAFTAGDDIRASAAIGQDGTIFVGAFDGLFYAIRPDGTLAWTFRAADRILSSALVDTTGAIAFGSQDDRLYVIEPDGRPRWSIELGGDVDASPVLGKDGTIYVGADDKKLYALRPADP